MPMLDRIWDATKSLLSPDRTPYLTRRSIPIDRLESAQQAVAGRLLSWQTTTPRYPPATWNNVVTRGYRRNAPFRRCVDMLSANACQARLHVVRAGTQEPVESEVVDLFRRGGRMVAQPGLTESTLWTQFYHDAYTTGNALWEKVRAVGSNKVVELWRLDPQRIAIEPDPRLRVKQYLYEVGGKWWPIPRENVIHWRFPDPYQDWFGIPPIMSALREIEVDNELTDHFKVTLQNHAVPAVVLEHDQAIKEPEAEEARRMWKKNHGRFRRGGAAVVGGGTTVKVVGLDMQKMAIGELVSVPESRIAMVHGVPIILLGRSGTQSDPTRANYAEAKEHFWFDTILPILGQVGEQVSTFLVPEFHPEGGVEAGFDCTSVAVLQAAKLRRAERAANVFASGMISRHTGQRLAGVPLQGPNVFYRSANVGGVIPYDATQELIELTEV